MDLVAEMFDTHPAPASDAGELAEALVRAAAQCAHTCTTCADACLEEADPAALRRCIRMNLDCTDICAATSRLIARPGKQSAIVLAAQLDACILACRACAEECDMHGQSMEHCRVCASACRACADACEEMRGAIVAG